MSFSADKFARLVLSDLQSRIRRRYPRFHLAPISKAASTASPPARQQSPASFFTLDNLLKITYFAIKDPSVLTFTAMVYTAQTVRSKVRQWMQSESTQRLATLRPNRHGKSIQPIDNDSNYQPELPDPAMEGFFITELGFSPLYTRRTLVPFVQDQMRKFDTERLFRQNEVFATVGFQALFVIAEAARLSPQRRQWELRKWAKKSFFLNRDFGCSTVECQEQEMEACPETAQDVGPICPNDLPWSLQGIRKLFAEQPMEHVSGMSVLFRQLTCVDSYRLIFHVVTIRRFDDGHVVVEKRETDKEQFPALRDVRFLFFPPAGDEVLEDLRYLFREKEARTSFSQRLKNSWKCFKSKFSRQSDGKVEKTGSLVEGWRRFKVAVSGNRD